MKSFIDKKQENTVRSAADGARFGQGYIEPTFQLIDNRPEFVAQRNLQKVVNNNSLSRQGVFQMMKKEREGSTEYNRLKAQKDGFDGQLATINAKTDEERKAEALKELVDLKDSQLRKYGTRDSYTPYYKDEKYPQELRTAWRMCEDERKGGDPMHNHQTKLEVDVYVQKREARIRQKEGSKAYELKQKSNEVSQLKGSEVMKPHGLK